MLRGNIKTADTTMYMVLRFMRILSSLTLYNYVRQFGAGRIKQSWHVVQTEQ